MDIREVMKEFSSGNGKQPLSDRLSNRILVD